MALVKCSECGHKISDQADSCPKCGYERQGVNHKRKSIDKKKYIIIGLVILVIAYFGITKMFEEQIKTYSSSYLNISFDHKNKYKVQTSDDGFIYVGEHYQENTAVIPYVIIGRYDDYKYPISFFTDFTNYMSKQYSDLKSSNIAGGVIGDKTAYQVTYKYSISNTPIVDVRYAIVLNDKIYMIGSREVNQNTDELNDMVKLIIETMKEGV